MKIHFQTSWPFLERSSTREARERLNQVLKNRPNVESKVDELVKRGQRNHFAELMQAEFERKRDNE